MRYKVSVVYRWAIKLHISLLKSYPRVYLEQFKYKIKKSKPVDFIDDKVDLSSDDSDD